MNSKQEMMISEDSWLSSKIIMKNASLPCEETMIRSSATKKTRSLSETKNLTVRIQIYNIVYNLKLIPDAKRKGEEEISVIKNKIRQLKKELQGLNDLFKIAVDKTKRQNDENHKIYSQNALINKLKVKIQKKQIKTQKQNQTYKDVINKLEKFGYGYQKTFKTKTSGNLKRQVSVPRKGKKRSKSFVKAKENIGVDYAIEETRRRRNGSPDNAEARRARKRAIKKYRSYTRSLTHRKGSSGRVGRSHKQFKTKGNNIDVILTRAVGIVGDKRGKSKKSLKKR